MNYRMSLLPSATTSGSNLPDNFYFALKEDAVAQVLSQSGNTVSLSGGGGSVNIASTTAVATSTQKLTGTSYVPGFQSTQFTGQVEVLSGAEGEAEFKGGLLTLTKNLANPALAMSRDDILGVGTMAWDGSKFLLPSVGISGEIYDSLGSAGAAGQQLQSSGPGLPWVWGAGSGVGLTAVVAGDNINVDNTNPIAPIVNVDETLVDIKRIIMEDASGDSPSVIFNNSLGVQKASVDYTGINDKLSLVANNLSLDGGGVAVIEMSSNGFMNVDASGISIDSTSSTLNMTGTGVSIDATAGAVGISAPAGQVSITSADANTSLSITPAGANFVSGVAPDTATTNVGPSGLTQNITTTAGDIANLGLGASITAGGYGVALGPAVGGNISANLNVATTPQSSSLTLNITNAPPFSYSKQTVLSTDSLIHTDTNPSLTAFTIQTDKDLELNLTNTASEIKVPNGNSIVITDLINTTRVNDNGVNSTFFQSNPGGGVGVVETAVANATSQIFLGATDLTTLAQQVLRAEVQANLDAVIDHETVNGTVRSLTMRTEGTLNLTAGYNISGATPALPVVLASSGQGGALNPGLRLTNTNATGSCALEVYKNKPTAGAIGDVLYNQSVFGKDSTNAKQEYTRISHTIRDPTNGAEDGSLEIGCFTNGAYTNFIQLNANDAPVGEVNVFRPIDFIGGSDANATVKVSGAGSVNLNLDATASAGAGAIALKTKDGVAGSGGGLLLTGNTLLSGSAGGTSGQHLCLTIGGTVYKIKLENP